MRRILAPIKNTLRDPRTREFLAWCLPALLAGLALRVVLIAHLPYAYFHDDAPDFLYTPDQLFREFELKLHSKKTFLSPILFTIPFFLPGPVLVTVPILQHLLGLGLVVLVGLLVRLWFRHWKWWIVPLTVLTAINPFFIWYEHTIMAESHFVFCTVLVAVAGSLYALEQTRARFVFLCVALFLEAGARPEGKLLFGFGLFFLALLHWREWRTQWPRFAVMLAVAIITHFATKTAQAPLLLYTSVARLTPPQLKSAPGFDPYIAPVRDDLNARWNERVQFPRVRDRRAVAAAVEKYLDENPGRGGTGSHASVNKFCLRLALETCARNITYLPEHVYHKFRFVANEAPSERLDNAKLFEKQREAYIDQLPLVERMAKRLTGTTLAGADDVNRFIDTHYGAVPWFNAWRDRWLRAVNKWRFPDRKFPNTEWPLMPHMYFGVPYYFVAAAIGLLIAMLRPWPLRPFHIAWGLTMLGFFFVIMLTANVRPRFRFVFEPFWFIYIALIVDTLCLGVAAVLRRR